MKHLISLILALLLATSAVAAEQGPVGYVDMQMILDKSKMGQQAQQALKEKFAGKQQEFAEEENSIRQLQQALERDQALMSQAELDGKKAALEKRVNEFQQKAAEAQKALVDEQNKLGAEIIKPVEGIIAAVAKDKKVSAVFERRQSGLLYVDPSIDLTGEIVKRLDAQNKK